MFKPSLYFDVHDDTGPNIIYAAFAKVSGLECAVDERKVAFGQGFARASIVQECYPDFTALERPRQWVVLYRNYIFSIMPASLYLLCEYMR